jgi:hypothetical protein
LGIEKTYRLSAINERSPRQKALPTVRALLEADPDLQSLELIKHVEQATGMKLSPASMSRIRQQLEPPPGHVV